MGAAKTNNDIKREKMKRALEKSLGIVTIACREVDIARETHYRWLREYPDYKAFSDGLSELVLDFAETQLHMQIKDGTPSSTIFFLKTKGRHRGYIERTELGIEEIPRIELVDGVKHLALENGKANGNKSLSREQNGQSEDILK